MGKGISTITVSADAGIKLQAIQFLWHCSGCAWHGEKSNF